MESYADIRPKDDEVKEPLELVGMYLIGKLNYLSLFTLLCTGNHVREW